MTGGAVTTRHAFYSLAVATAHATGFAQQFRPGYGWLAGQIQSSAARPYLYDVGCGDGSFLAAMGELGLFGEGIDISGAFVAMARRRGLKVRQDSAAQAALPPQTTAVTALGEVLAYAPAALAPFAARAARALPEGGVVILDLPGPGTPERETEAQGEAEGEPWTLSARTRIEGRKLKRDIEMEFQGRRIEEWHEQHLFSPEDATGIFGGLGFDTELFDSYGPCPLLPGRFALVARKR